MMSERLGKLSFWVMFIGFNLAFFPMHLTGIAGMPRRIYTYPPGLGWDGLNSLSTVGAFILGVGILISIVNFFLSLNGPLAGRNPWNADTLEWELPSPPPSYGTVHIPTVRTRHPLWDDYDEEYDPGNRRVWDQGRLTVSTTLLDAEPVALAKMPEDTLTPLYVTLALAVFFSGIVARNLWVALAGAIAGLVVMAFWMWPERERSEA
jgi:cytochrome c oxidase subunit 1/cytochrome c oxidase subunit I+III